MAVDERINRFTPVDVQASSRLVIAPTLSRMYLNGSRIDSPT